MDPLVSIGHYFVFRSSKKVGRWCQKARSISQGYNEAFDVTDDETSSKAKKIPFIPTGYPVSKGAKHVDIDLN